MRGIWKTQNIMEKTLKALANRRRLAIIKYLKNEGEAAVGDISRAINLSFKATARHLATLFAADILEKEQRNIFVFYRISKNCKDVSRAVIKLI
jgi:DNA-binding transcriptional ArsR family regulator